jgi:cytochrome P450
LSSLYACIANSPAPHVCVGQYLAWLEMTKAPNALRGGRRSVG